MSDACFTERLTMTCTIQRASRVENAQNEEEETWADSSIGVACRLEIPSFGSSVGSEFTERKQVFIENALIYFEANTDIQNRDRITNVVRTSNISVIKAGPLSVIEVVKADDLDGSVHHIEAILDNVVS